MIPMRNFHFILLLFIVPLAGAQPLPEQIKTAFRVDDADKVTNLVSSKTVDACYEAGNSKYTLLALTIKGNSKKIFNALMDQDADIEKACAGKTPLMYGAKYGRLDMVKALIQAGADHDFVNNKLRTALSYARKYQQKEVYVYLKTLD